MYSHAYRLALQFCRVRMLHTYSIVLSEGNSVIHLSVSLPATEGLKIIGTRLKLPAIKLIHTECPVKGFTNVFTHTFNTLTF